LWFFDALTNYRIIYRSRERRGDPNDNAGLTEPKSLQRPAIDFQPHLRKLPPFYSGLRTPTNTDGSARLPGRSVLQREGAKGLRLNRDNQPSWTQVQLGSKSGLNFLLSVGALV